VNPCRPNRCRASAGSSGQLSGRGILSVTIAADAGVVQRQNTSFPSSERGFDSRRPLSGNGLVRREGPGGPGSAYPGRAARTVAESFGGGVVPEELSCLFEEDHARLTTPGKPEARWAELRVMSVITR
jgi:hypothetical protein